MMVLALPNARHLGLARMLGTAGGFVLVHRFPDGEGRVTLPTSVAGRDVVLVANLTRPDQRVLPLVFAAATARDLGATSVGLVAPYLPYMRQDHAFQPGQGVSARHFAALLSQAVDWLVTVDPHLHRIRTLSEIFAIPASAVHAAPLLAAWIRRHVTEPVIFGPDGESRQWAASVAELARAPFAVFAKRRTGDRDVTLRVPDLREYRGRQPVLLDDVIASGATMSAAILALRRAHQPAPICMAVHGIFAGEVFEMLQDAGAAAVVTTNTIRHPSNAIDVASLLAAAVRQSRGFFPPPSLFLQDGRHMMEARPQQ
jgi:ribose-phosphate pyrophosphokinase